MNPEDTLSTPLVQQDDWQALPPQARQLFMISGAGLALPAGIGAAILSAVLRMPFDGLWLLAGLLGAGFGIWLGWQRYRHTHWRLDRDSLSLRTGRIWQSEVRVPVNRVQHLDLRRGPLERRYRLATLSIHTAGTRDSSVNLGGLADADAEHLRDLLARQVEHDHP